MESVYKNQKTSKDLILEEHKTESIIERVEYDDGIKLYIKGAQFPQKSCPTPEAIIAINTVKRVLISFLTSGLIPISKIRLLKTFNRITADVMHQHLLKEKYMTRFSREMKLFIFNFLTAWGIDEETAMTTSEIIAHIFEYDNAYRYRVQDILEETTREVSIVELRRLAKIIYEREDIESRKANGNRRVGKQFIRAANFLSVLFLLPSFRRALKVAITNLNWSAVLMDDGDRYWSGFRIDYNFGGKTYEERMIDYKKRGFNLPIV